MFFILAQTTPTANQVESGFVYVIAAFVVIWLFIAAYLFWLNSRQESLRREVQALRQEETERLHAESVGVGVGEVEVKVKVGTFD